MQAAPAGPSLLMLSTVSVVLGLVAGAAVQVWRRRARMARRLAAAAGVIALLYGMALVGVGIASSPGQLPPGATKCFDDWCVAMLNAHEDRVQGRLLVDTRLENRGRGRAMRSLLAMAFVTRRGGDDLRPSNGAGLQMLVQPGEKADLELEFPLPAGTLLNPRFVVTESPPGFGPGTLTIDDESSPFHPKTGWPLQLSTT